MILRYCIVLGALGLFYTWTTLCAGNKFDHTKKSEAIKIPLPPSKPPLHPESIRHFQIKKLTAMLKGQPKVPKLLKENVKKS
jgi:hypothetical protein